MKKSNAIVKIILFLMLGCIGCKQSDVQLNDFITVDVTANYPKKELILQNFMDVEYIPLETSDEFLTSARICDIGNDIMIFRNMNRGDGDILLFDRNGKGLRKINRHGQGGEEYTNVQEAILDEDNGEIFVNNTFAQKILVYDLFGNFKRSFRNKGNLMVSPIGDFDQDNLICVDYYFYLDKGVIVNKKRNCFLIMSKQDGTVREISTPYEKKITTMVIKLDSNGKIIGDRSIYNRELIPSQDGWILYEISSDTIYNYSRDHTLTPLIVRTPSIQSMEPEVLLYPGVQTDSYFFMQTVKKDYDFVANTGFPRTDLVYDRKENTLFECVVYNNDFTNKKSMSLVYEQPMYAFINSEIAFAKKLEAFDLVEAYKNGQLKGKLKEIAATLDEESNPVIMIAKYKK